MKQFLTLRKTAFCVLLLSCSCSAVKNAANYTGKWNGSDVPGHNFASFEDLNGRQEFDLKPSGKGESMLVYHTVLRNGSLHMKLLAPFGPLLDIDLPGTITDSVKIDRSRKYKLIFEGKQAEGSFDIKY